MLNLNLILVTQNIPSEYWTKKIELPEGQPPSGTRCNGVSILKKKPRGNPKTILWRTFLSFTLLFRLVASKKEVCSKVDENVTEDMCLMYMYVYNEMFFPKHLSCEKANDRLA